MIGRRGGGVLRYPEALALAANGDVYVGDQYSYLVQRFDAQGDFLGQWGEHGTGQGDFGAIGGIALSEDGDAYVVDSTHNRIEEFDSSAHFVRAWGGFGSQPGRFDFGAGAPGVPPGGGIAVAGDYVYVADTGNDRIQRFTLQGGDPVVWGQQGDAPGELDNPRGIAVNDGSLYIADCGNNRIVMLSTADGSFERETGEGGSGETQFSGPFDVAVSARGEVFVADDNHHRVVKLNSDLHFKRAWTIETLEGESEGRHANYGSEQVSYPRAVAVSPDGIVYVADAAAQQIYMYSTRGAPLGVWGTSARSYGQFMLPVDVATTASGATLVDDMIGGRIEAFDGRRAFLASVDGGDEILGRHLFTPVALALLPNGSMWVADRENGLVRHLSIDGGLVGTLGGSQPDERLVGPSGVAVASNGDVYVADTGQGLVRRFSASGKPLGSWGGVGSGPGRMRAPTAVAVAPSGEVYVVDAGNDRVKRFSADGRFLGQWGERGPRPGGLLNPEGITVDWRGNVFVADTGGSRIEEFGVHGHLLRSWGDLGSGVGQLDGPAGLTVNCRGELLVADVYNNRVVRFTGVAPPCAAGVSGTP